MKSFGNNRFSDDFMKKLGDDPLFAISNLLIKCEQILTFYLIPQIYKTKSL